MFSIQYVEKYTFLFWMLSVTKAHTKLFQKSKPDLLKNKK